MSAEFGDIPIEFVKGIGPKRAEWLRTELGVHAAGDLLEHLPFRYEDRTRFAQVSDLASDAVAIQLQGVITGLTQVPAKRGFRLVAKFQDDTGTLELVWFKGAKWMASQIPVQQKVIVYGKPAKYQGRWNMPHPEIELQEHFEQRKGGGLQPVYRTTEKLTNRGLSSSGLAKVIRTLLAHPEFAMGECLPQAVLEELQLPNRTEAFRSAMPLRMWTRQKEAESG